MLVEATYKELKDRQDLTWIDVRSESEFTESSIPGAINIPLFNNEERAQIGTVYKQVNPVQARWLGLGIASRKLPEIVKQIADEAADRVAAIYCWRGGMRSRSVVTVLELMGIRAVRLTGGYRGYRQYVTERLATMAPTDIPPLIVIHGMTGVGKTTLLRRLADLGEPVLDLERLARHRGSVFGGIGLKPANQRQFDAVLLETLEVVRGRPYLMMEAESKRIGHATMPDFLYEAKRTALHVELAAPLTVRVQRTLEQYALADGEALHQAVERAIAFIQNRFSPDLRKRVAEWMKMRAYAPMIAALLEEYYDPRYQHAQGEYGRPEVVVDATDLDRAAAYLCEQVWQSGRPS